MKGLLQTMCPVIFEKNFIGKRWTKLLVNSTFSGLSIVLGASFGEIIDNSKSRLCCQYVMKECFNAAKYNSVKFEPLQGWDPLKMWDFDGELTQTIKFYFIPITMRNHRQIRASMLQDIENGKPTEIDSINGVICEYGRKKNVKTLFNDKIVEIVHLIEVKNLRPSFENLSLFNDLIPKNRNILPPVLILIIIVFVVFVIFINLIRFIF